MFRSFALMKYLFVEKLKVLKAERDLERANLAFASLDSDESGRYMYMLYNALHFSEVFVTCRIISVDVRGIQVDKNKYSNTKKNAINTDYFTDMFRCHAN